MGPSSSSSFSSFTITYRRWPPTDMDAFFSFSFLALLFVQQDNKLFKTGLSIPVNQNASKRKEGKSHCLLQWSRLNPPFLRFSNGQDLLKSDYVGTI